MADSQESQTLGILLLLFIFVVFLFFYIVYFLISTCILSSCCRGTKGVQFSRFLWLCCPGGQLHLWHLGRDLQLFLYCSTCAFCGLGWLRDFFRISDYVDHASGTMSRYWDIRKKDRVAATINGRRVEGIIREPKFELPFVKSVFDIEGNGTEEAFVYELELVSPKGSWGRFIAAFLLSVLWSFQLQCLLTAQFFMDIEDVGSEGILDDNSSYEIYQKLCCIMGAILSCFIVGNIGEQKVDLWPLVQYGIIGGSVALAIADIEQSSFLIFMIVWYSWRCNRKFRNRLAALQQSCCFRISKFSLWCAIYVLITSVGIYNYGSIPLDIEGKNQTIDVKNLYKTWSNQYYEWAESEEGQELFHNLSEAWTYISYRLENEGWENLFNDFTSQIFEDVQSDAAKTLGVETDATCAEVKKQFRKLSRKYHPDKNPGDPETKSKYMEIVQAYDVMKEQCSNEKTEL